MRLVMHRLHSGPALSTQKEAVGSRQMIAVGSWRKAERLSGLFIFLAVIGFNLMGDGIRDVMDPKMKR